MKKKARLHPEDVELITNHVVDKLQDLLNTDAKFALN